MSVSVRERMSGRVSASERKSWRVAFNTVQATANEGEERDVNNTSAPLSSPHHHPHSNRRPRSRSSPRSVIVLIFATSACFVL